MIYASTSLFRDLMAHGAALSDIYRRTTFPRAGGGDPVIKVLMQRIISSAARCALRVVKFPRRPSLLGLAVQKRFLPSASKMSSGAGAQPDAKKYVLACAIRVA